MLECAKRNILGGKWTLAAYLVYGGFLMFFLFQTVHDRSDIELELRTDDRFEKIINVWINDGFIKHAGMWFEISLDEKPEQFVHRSVIMGFLYGPYLLERLHFALTGEFSLRLMAYYNQLIPMLSSALLGFLAMRLVVPLGVSLASAFLLGIGVQTAYQTFPFNLGLFWNNIQPNAIPFVLIFFLLETHVFNGKDTQKLKLCRSVALFFMFLADFQSSLFFIISYLLIKTITVPRFDLKSDLKIMFTPAMCIAVIWMSEALWLMMTQPGVQFSGHGINYRTGFDGATTYYNTHLELFDSKWNYVFPSWNTMWMLGALALVAVITFVQKNKKLISHQTILLAGLALYIPMAFFFSQNGAIHPDCFDPYLAIPFYLAFFGLLPAWLESFSNHSGKFVLFATLAAFSCSGIQLAAYFLHVPPYFYL